MSDSDQVKQNADKVISYHQRLLSYVESEEEIQFITKEDLEKWDFYDKIEEATEIFKKYRSGDYDYSIATADILRLSAMLAELIPITGAFKGSTKHFGELRRSEKSRFELLAKDKNLEDRISDSRIAKMTDKTAESIANVASKDFTKKIMEVEALSETFSSYVNLILHFTTILNSILKRDFDAENANYIGNKRLTKQSEDYLYNSSEGATL